MLECDYSNVYGVSDGLENVVTERTFGIDVGTILELDKTATATRKGCRGLGDNLLHTTIEQTLFFMPIGWCEVLIRPTGCDARDTGQGNTIKQNGSNMTNEKTPSATPTYT